MKAAVYNGKKGIAIAEKSIPEIGTTDILVRNLRSGICGTDINIVKAGSEAGIRYGSEFGHEMVSEIVAVGTEVSGEIRPGMIVGINPITAKHAGRRYSLECGGFSQYIVVEDAELDYNVFEFRKDISLEAAALMEPLSVGRHGAFRVNPKRGDHIVVLGAGPIGLGAAASLIAEGITDVCVVDMDEWRLERAEEIGAKTVNSGKVDLERGISEIFGRVDVYGREVPDVDAFIDTAGAVSLFDKVKTIVKTNAVISIIAVYKQEVSLSLIDMMSKEFHLLGSSGYTTEDIKAVVGYLNQHKIKTDSIVSRVYKLADIEEAFRVAIGAKEVIKVLIDME